MIKVPNQKKSVIRIIIFGLYEEEFEEHDPEYIAFDIFNAIIFILKKLYSHYDQLFLNFTKNHRFINWKPHLLDQCDQIGAPLELTDAQGHITWAADYKVWGEATLKAVPSQATGTDGMAGPRRQGHGPDAISWGGLPAKIRLDSINIG